MSWSTVTLSQPIHSSQNPNNRSIQVCVFQYEIQSSPADLQVRLHCCSTSILHGRPVEIGFLSCLVQYKTTTLSMFSVLLVVHAELSIAELCNICFPILLIERLTNQCLPEIRIYSKNQATHCTYWISAQLQYTAVEKYKESTLTAGGETLLTNTEHGNPHFFHRPLSWIFPLSGPEVCSGPEGSHTNKTRANTNFLLAEP